MPRASRPDPVDGQGSLFDATPVVRADRQGVGEPERKAPAARSSLHERPSWGKHTGRHEPCAIGALNTWAADVGRKGYGLPHMENARYVRTYRGERTPMCHHCAVHWREADGFSGLPG